MIFNRVLLLYPIDATCILFRQWVFFFVYLLNRGVISKGKRRQWVWLDGTIHPCDNDLFDDFLADIESGFYNSLVPVKFQWNVGYVIFQEILVIDGCEIALIRMSVDFTDDQSTLVQVMAWCRQATSHYLSQWWPRSLTPYGFTRPQWVDSSITSTSGSDF